MTLNEALIAYRIEQLEKRQAEHEAAVSQIRDAIISVRNDSTEIRNRMTAMEQRAARHEHDGEFRWTKVQVTFAASIGVVVVVLQIITAVKK